MKWKTRIGFWNVRTLTEYGKLKQVEKEMTPKRTWRRTTEDEIRSTGRAWNEVKGIAGDRNNNNNNNNIYLFTAIGLLPGGSGYFTCIHR